MPRATLFIPNVATDVGLSAPFNSMFTLFGQFFDHGLDLVTKGGGTVFMPLQAGRPARTTRAARTNFMILTRATNQPGRGRHPRQRRRRQDQQHDDAVRRPEPDLHLPPVPPGLPARRTRRRDGGPPVDTGQLITGAGGDGMADWAGVKAQALERLGIVLTDTDVTNVPMLARRPVRQLRPGPNGYPQIVTADGMVEADDPSSGQPGRSRREAGASPRHAFLDDIAHHAAPTGDRDPANGPGTDRGSRRRTPTRARPTTATRRPTTTRCSTRTSSPVTAGPTRTSA